MTIQMLERSRRAQKEIEEMSCDLVELGKGFDAVTAVYGKTGGGRSPDVPDTTANYVVKMDALQAKLSERRRQYVEDMMAITQWAVDVLPTAYKSVAIRYYANANTVKQVAATLHYTPGHVHRLLREIRKIAREDGTGDEGV